jgi:hypothetical protein
MATAKKMTMTKKKPRKKNPVVAKKPLTKEFISHVGYIKAVYHEPIEMWKLYKRQGAAWKLLGAVRGTARTTDKQLIAKIPAGEKKRPIRKSNPLKKWIFFVGPQFPDTDKGKQECAEFAQRFANKYGVVGHVYKA